MLRRVFRLLRRGGGSSLLGHYADRRVPAAVHDDPVLYGRMPERRAVLERLSRARPRRNFADRASVEDRPLAATDPALAAKAGRRPLLFGDLAAVPDERTGERLRDFGRAVVYRGTLPNKPRFVLSISGTWSTPAGSYR